MNMHIDKCHLSDSLTRTAAVAMVDVMGDVVKLVTSWRAQLSEQSMVAQKRTPELHLCGVYKLVQAAAELPSV